MYMKSLGTIRPSAITAFGETTVVCGTGVGSGVVLQAEITRTATKIKISEKYFFIVTFSFKTKVDWGIIALNHQSLNSIHKPKLREWSAGLRYVQVTRWPMLKGSIRGSAKSQNQWG